MQQAKKKVGCPKLDWAPFETELQRRLDNGEAKETVTLEAQYLADWAERTHYATQYGTYLKWERIRDRIRRRYEGANGYKQTRDWKLNILLTKARQPAA